MKTLSFRSLGTQRCRRCSLHGAVVALLLQGAMVAAAAAWGTPANAEEARGDGFVPKAVCGPTDRKETMQGRVTLAERFAPGPTKTYSCNLQLVGKYVGDGSSYSSAEFDNCAYFSTTDDPEQTHPGVVTLDVSDPVNPRATDYLVSKGMLYANESLTTNYRRRLLVGSAAWVNTEFDVYDLSKDCTHPILLSSTAFPHVRIHEGRLTSDGMTYFGAMWSGTALPPGSMYFYPKPTPNDPPPSALFAIDLTNPVKPRLMNTWIPASPAWRTHSANVSKDGTRVYVAMYHELDDGWQKNQNANGVVVLDSSDFQLRRADPQFRVVGTLFWKDVHFAQYALPITVEGRPYLIFSDLVGAIGAGMVGGAPTNEVSPTACNSGKPNFGFARIIDIANDADPKIVSKLMLEVDDPANCKSVRYDLTIGYRYGAEACSVDNDTDAHLLACAYMEGGLRVFDIRDVAHPREIAYYKPPAAGDQKRPGNSFASYVLASPRSPPATKSEVRGAKPNHPNTADQVYQPHFHGSAGGLEIWLNSSDNGFQVVRFTEEFERRESSLFAALRGTAN